MAKDKLSPLPVGNGLVPMNDPGDAIPAALALPLDAPSPTEAWLAEHPTNDFDPNAAPAPVTPPIPLDTTDEDETPETPAPEVTPPVEGETPETPAPETPAPVEGETPVVTPPVAAVPAVVAPVEPVKPVFAPTDEIALAEGVTWTREQVVAALQERMTLTPFKEQAETFSKIFRMDAKKAEEVWGPVVERITAEPALAKFIDGYMRDPEKQEYLDQCAAYYDEAVPPVAQPVRAPVAQLDPTVKRQLDELTAFKAEREREIAVARFNNEVEQVKARYPFVVADPAMFNDLRETARYLYAQDPSKGMLDALALKAPLYDAVAIARATQQPLQNVTPAAPAVPALPSSGAAPGASRPTPVRAKKFADTDEATAAWLATDHPEFEGN